MVKRRNKLARRIGRLVAQLSLGGLLLGVSARELGAVPPPTANAADPEATERRLYFGMWTLHFRDLDRGLDNNWLIGMSWGRIYGATFINSFGKRAYALGVQRTMARWKPGLVSVGLGCRAGLVTGYDERLFPLAGETPALPVVQPVINLDFVNGLGWELSYAGVTASASLNVRW